MKAGEGSTGHCREQGWVAGQVPQGHQTAGKKVSPELSLPHWVFISFSTILTFVFLFQAFLYTLGKQAQYKTELLTKGWFWLKHKDRCSFLC